MASLKWKHFRYGWKEWFIILSLIILQLEQIYSAKEGKPSKKLKAKKLNKDISDYSDTDIYHLLDQWNENDDEYDPTEDDDPRFKPQPKMQFDPKLMAKDPQAMLKLSKKGKPLMLFVTVAGNPSQKQTEEISAQWQQSLHNAQFQIQRYVISQNRVLFSLEDGSQAWDIKDYLVTQKNCVSVDFENQQFPCVGSDKGKSKTEL